MSLPVDSTRYSFSRISIIGRCLLGAAMLVSCGSYGEELALTSNSQPGWIWDLVIAAIVLSVSAASAVMPVSALRQWTGAWRIGALASLLLLFGWVAVIVISRLDDSNSHALWPLEIFAWAMLNLIYMVSLMTIKRIFEKADALEANTAPPLE
jgi:hypothetical protein